MLSGQSEITSSKSQIHSFSQFHPLSTKLSPRNQEETPIAAQERKAFDFEVGDGWKDLIPNLLQSNDFAETKCFYTVIECTSLQSLRICLTQTAGGSVPVPPCREEVWMLVLFYHVLSVLSINLMIVHLYKSQQVYSTSVNLLLEQRKQTEQQKKQKNLDLDVSTVCETPSCWQRNVLELMGNQQLHVVGRWDDSPFFVCASEDGG